MIDRTNNDGKWAVYRSAARRLMTLLARQAHTLPSSLELPDNRIKLTTVRHIQGTMRQQIQGSAGSYGEVSFAEMYCPKRKRNIAIAIKSFKATLSADQYKVSLVFSNW